MAQADYFLKIEGVDGESRDRGHEKWIEVQSFSWGLSNPGSVVGGGGAGKVSFQDFSFTANSGVQSPPLMVGCASGKHFAKASLSVRLGGQKQAAFLKVTLEDCLISSYQVGATDAGDSGQPRDQFSLGFSRATLSVSPQNADGSLGTPVTGSVGVSTPT